MTQNTRKAGLIAATLLTAITTIGVMPAPANAQQPRWSQRDRDRDRDRRRDWNQQDDKRQKTKNDWRNLAIAAGGIAAFGAIKGDPYIGFGGLAGALYSMNRYEQDRKSQSSTSRARASIFSQPYVYRDGRRYERRMVNKNGQRYYQFVRQ